MISLIRNKWRNKNITVNEMKTYLYLNDWQQHDDCFNSTSWTNKMKLIFDNSEYVGRQWFTLDEAYIIESQGLYTEKIVKIDNSDLIQQLKTATDATEAISKAMLNSNIDFSKSVDNYQQIKNSFVNNFGKK